MSISQQQLDDFTELTLDHYRRWPTKQDSERLERIEAALVAAMEAINQSFVPAGFKATRVYIASFQHNRRDCHFDKHVPGGMITARWTADILETIWEGLISDSVQDRLVAYLTLEDRCQMAIDDLRKFQEQLNATAEQEASQADDRGGTSQTGPD